VQSPETHSLSSYLEVPLVNLKSHTDKQNHTELPNADRKDTSCHITGSFPTSSPQLSGRLRTADVLSRSRVQGPGANILELVALPAAPSVSSPLPPRSKLLTSVGPADNKDTLSPLLRHPRFPTDWGAGPWPWPCSSVAASICRLFRNCASDQEKELCLISSPPTYLNSLSILESCQGQLQENQTNRCKLILRLPASYTPATLLISRIREPPP